MEEALVLVVEDDPDQRDLLRTIVEELVGARVRLASTLEEGLEAFRVEGAGLVVLDLMLGAGSGMDFIRAVRGLPGHQTTPVIVLSAAAPRLREDAFAAGATDWMAKPFDIDALATSIRLFLAADESPGRGA